MCGVLNRAKDTVTLRFWFCSISGSIAACAASTTTSQLRQSAVAACNRASPRLCTRMKGCQVGTGLVGLHASLLVTMNQAASVSIVGGETFQHMYLVALQQ